MIGPHPTARSALFGWTCLALRAALFPMVAAAICLVATAALAQRPRRVVVVVSTMDPTLNRAVRSEIRTLGWEIVSVEPSINGLAPEGDADLPAARLERIAEQHEASAVVRIAAARIDLWIADPETGTTAIEEQVELGDAMTVEVAALHTVEVLRARLMELGFAVGSTTPSPEPPLGRPDAPPGSGEATTPSSSKTGLDGGTSDETNGRERAPEALTPSARPRSWIAVGPGAGVSGGGLGVSLQAAVSARLELSSHLSFGALVVLPTVASTVSAPSGSAEVLWGIGAVTVNASFAALAEGRWLVGAGVGAAGVRVEGRADPPLADRVVWIPAGAGFLRAGWIQPLSRRFALRLELLAGATAPRPVVRLDDRIEASFGRPFGLASLAVELGAF